MQLRILFIILHFILKKAVLRLLTALFNQEYQYDFGSPNIMMTIKKILIAFAMFITAWPAIHAQDVGIKTNLVSDGFASPNLGVEVGLAPKWTLNLVGQVNFWDVNRHKWKHWLFQPEARYWLCDRFAGSFFGVHAIGGQYNFGNIRNSINFLGSNFSELTDYRFQGWGVGAGIAYGYAWILGKHWNLEAEIGIGWIYTKYDKFKCNNCGKKIESGKTHNYFGPTKAAINLEYIF